MSVELSWLQTERELETRAAGSTAAGYLANYIWAGNDPVALIAAPSFPALSQPELPYTIEGLKHLADSLNTLGYVEQSKLVVARRQQLVEAPKPGWHQSLSV